MTPCSLETCYWTRLPLVSRASGQYADHVPTDIANCTYCNVYSSSTLSEQTCSEHKFPNVCVHATVTFCVNFVQYFQVYICY